MQRLLPLFLIVACSADPATPEVAPTAAPDAAAPAPPASPEAAPAAEAWACPMHPEVTGSEGDDCHKCGMPLERSGGGDAGAANDAKHDDKHGASEHQCDDH